MNSHAPLTDEQRGRVRDVDDIVEAIAHIMRSLVGLVIVFVPFFALGLLTRSTPCIGGAFTGVAGAAAAIFGFLLFGILPITLLMLHIAEVDLGCAMQSASEALQIRTQWMQVYGILMLFGWGTGIGLWATAEPSFNPVCSLILLLVVLAHLFIGLICFGLFLMSWSYRSDVRMLLSHRSGAEV